MERNYDGSIYARQLAKLTTSGRKVETYKHNTYKHNDDGHLSRRAMFATSHAPAFFCGSLFNRPGLAETVDVIAELRAGVEDVDGLQVLERAGAIVTGECWFAEIECLRANPDVISIGQVMRDLA